MERGRPARLERVCEKRPGGSAERSRAGSGLKKALVKSFDRLRTNGNGWIPFVVSVSNALLSEVEGPVLSLSKGHERNPLVQSFLNEISPIRFYGVGANEFAPTYEMKTP